MKFMLELFYGLVLSVSSISESSARTVSCFLKLRLHTINFGKKFIQYNRVTAYLFYVLIFGIISVVRVFQTR